MPPKGRQNRIPIIAKMSMADLTITQRQWLHHDIDIHIPLLYLPHDWYFHDADIHVGRRVLELVVRNCESQVRQPLEQAGYIDVSMSENNILGRILTHRTQPQAQHELGLQRHNGGHRNRMQGSSREGCLGAS